MSTAVYKNSVLRNVFIITHQITKQVEYASLPFTASKRDKNKTCSLVQETKLCSKENW